MSRELNTISTKKLEVQETALAKRLEKLERKLVSQSSKTEAEISELLKKQEELEKQFDYFALVQENKKEEEKQNKNHKNNFVNYFDDQSEKTRPELEKYELSADSYNSYLRDLSDYQKQLSASISGIEL
tara:strand:+ start:327 stop:713 length:387 start_codon:yes stop_codon:yes gene_type:complete